MMNFIKRNAPIFVIGVITLLVFSGIILLSQFRNGDNNPELVEVVPEETLVSTDSMTIGNEDAPVVLVEFADYECPACKAFSPLVKKLYDENKEYLKVVYRHYPLPQHSLARGAAAAVEAAGEQGRFWDYSNILYENQPNFSRENYIRFAGELGMDVTKFANDLDSGKYTEKINKDVELANNLNVNATPTFYLNGKKMNIKTFDDFVTQVQNEIAKAKQSLNIEEENNSEPEREPLTKTRTETIYVKFGETGFSPMHLTAYTGQLVRWTNETTADIVIKQNVEVFPEFSRGLTIKPGEYFEIRMTGERLWTYTEQTTQKSGSIYIRTN